MRGSFASHGPHVRSTSAGVLELEQGLSLKAEFREKRGQRRLFDWPIYHLQSGEENHQGRVCQDPARHVMLSDSRGPAAGLVETR